jgi:histidine triad (HIT) family protein
MSDAAQSCLFCRLVKGEIPAQVVHRDDEIIAFGDINPQAPTHLLVIPRRHIARITEAAPEDAALLGRLFLVASKLAADRGFAEDGFRLVMNNGPKAGQTVFHIHLHLLGGRAFGWPPG